jgi:hypothetical protein
LNDLRKTANTKAPNAIAAITKSLILELEMKFKQKEGEESEFHEQLKFSKHENFFNYFYQHILSLHP